MWLEFPVYMIFPCKLFFESDPWYVSDNIGVSPRQQSPSTFVNMQVEIAVKAFNFYISICFAYRACIFLGLFCFWVNPRRPLHVPSREWFIILYVWTRTPDLNHDHHSRSEPTAGIAQFVRALWLLTARS